MESERTAIAALLTLAVAVALVGCGNGSGGGLPASGTAISCDASMYIANGACRAFPPFSDAAVLFDDASSDAAGPDGAAPSDDASEPQDGPAPSIPGDGGRTCAATRPGARVVQASAGGGHTCVVFDDGTVDCWGNNDSGQLGDGTTTPRPVPAQVPCLAGVVQVSAGSEHTCAVDRDGGVWCWGDNSSNEIGIGTGSAILSPALVVGLNGFVQVAAGSMHTCGRRGDGTVACWGTDTNGELGTAWDGHSVPPDVPGIVATQVVTGAEHTCALLAGGTVECWGDDSDGQRGDPPPGTFGDMPTQAAGVVSAVAVSANASNDTCAVVADAGGVCWGDDFEGELGNGASGSTANDVPPAAVVGGAGIVSMAAGPLFTCGIWNDGTVQCWGSGAYGSLGNGLFVDENAPVPIPALKGALGVTAGWAHGCAWFADGSLQCWGDDRYGQLGDGTTATRATPATVVFADVPPATGDASSPDGSPGDSVTDASSGLSNDAELAPCLTGGNVLHVSGDPTDTIYPAAATLTPADGTWSVRVSPVSLQVLVGNAWGLGISDLVTEVALAPGTFPFGPSTGTQTTFTLSADGRYCSQPSGSMTFEVFDTTGGDQPALIEVTATFEQHCNGTVAALRGCVHYHE